MAKFQYSTTPKLHCPNRMSLTTRRDVSCYGVSAAWNRAARRTVCYDESLAEFSSGLEPNIHV